MEEISDARFSILLSPRIFHQWRILKVINMRTLLTEYLPPHILDHCCTLDIDNGSALRRLHRHLLQSNNDALYTAIVNYCKCKFETLDDLVAFMSVDLEESHLENDGLTENQHDMLTQKNVILPMFKAAWEVNRMTEVLMAYHDEEVESICSEINNDKAVFSLYKKIFKVDKRSFLENIVNFCEDQSDKYKQRFDFMTHDCEEDLDGSNHMMDVPVNRVQHDDVKGIKSRTNELRSALIQLNRELTDQLGAVVMQSSANQKFTEDQMRRFLTLMEEMEAKVKDQVMNHQKEINFLQRLENVNSNLQKEIAQLHTQMQANNKKCEAIAAELWQEREASEIKVQEFKVKLQNEKSKHEKHKAAFADLRKQIEQGNTRKQAQNSIHQKEIQKLHTKIQTFKDDVIRAIAPFPSPPTTEMINIQRTFKWLGLSPLMCNEFGCYPLIDWRNLKEFNWTRQWNIMRTKKSVDKKNGPVALTFPPLLLPADLGGWMIDLFLKWHEEEFIVAGGLYSEDHNKDAPAPMKVLMSVKININENVNFSQQHTFTFNTAKKNEKGENISEKFLIISPDMKVDWAMPCISVRIEKQ